MVPWKPLALLSFQMLGDPGQHDIHLGADQRRDFVAGRLDPSPSRSCGLYPNPVDFEGLKPPAMRPCHPC